MTYSGEYLQSKEMDDFRIFLQLCNDLEIKPYIVMMNTNGFYYDYIGIPQQVRKNLYNSIKAECEKYGFTCLTLEDKEYEP